MPTCMSGHIVAMAARGRDGGENQSPPPQSETAARILGSRRLAAAGVEVGRCQALDGSRPAPRSMACAALDGPGLGRTR